MSKTHFLSGALLVIAILLAGCEPENLEAGQVPGSVSHNTQTGQAPGWVGTMEPGKTRECGNNPDFICGPTNNPQTPLPAQETVERQPPLSHPNQPGPTDNLIDWLVYKDNHYGYKIEYPPQFNFKVLQNNELAKLKPEPVAVINFNAPSTNLGGNVPPNFSIRIYEVGSGTSVEAWLKSNGLFLPDSGWTIEKYQGNHFVGYQVNSALLIAPGWFIYATQGQYLYQLTALGSQAETMLTTFEFTP